MPMASKKEKYYMVRRFGITTERAGVLHHIWDTSNFLPNLSMTLFLWVVLIVCLWGCGFAEIYDPLNVFCGSYNCYDLLGVPRDASVKEIKKAYRKLSLTHHPDKSLDKVNATEVFHQITKAHDVLTNNESRPLFDYYLDHPKDYFKVSGQHYYQNLPKSDVRLVLLIVVALLSWFFHHIQYQKYDKLVKYLKYAVINNLNLKNGGTKQTMELFIRASEMYEEHILELKKRGDKSANKSKMLKDNAFEKIVDKMISELKIEGGYKKPEWHDLFAMKLILFPYNFFVWCKTYYRRYYSHQPLSMEDKIEMARSVVGYGSWEECTEDERSMFISMEVWKPGVYETWKKDREEEELRKFQQMASKGRKGKRKAGRKHQVEDEDEEEDYIE